MFVFFCVIKIFNIVFEEMGQYYFLVECYWCLNECYYGVLIGLDKVEIVVKYGEEQVKIWCCSFDILFLVVEDDSEYFLGYDLCYNNVDVDILLCGESLKLIIECVLLYWYDVICLDI